MAGGPSLLQRYQPARSLKSEASALLTVPRARLCTAGDRSFPVYAPNCGALYHIFSSSFQTCTEVSFVWTGLFNLTIILLDKTYRLLTIELMSIDPVFNSLIYLSLLGALKLLYK